MTASSIALWSVSDNVLERVSPSEIDREQRLEDWILSNPEILGERLLLVGRQVQTRYGGRVDLLAVDGDGRVVVIELKKGRTPREIVAQVLDYLSWSVELSADEVRDIAARTHDAPFAELFAGTFGTSAVPDLNSAQRGLIVATDADEATTRIIGYLTRSFGLDINVVTLASFMHNGQQLLARSWTIDPAELEELVAPPISDSAANAKDRVWTGFWHVNVGVHTDEHIGRNWDDPRRYGFISAGQGTVWRDEIMKLRTGSRIFAYLNTYGYVGAGVVVSEAVPAKDFISPVDGKPLSQLLPPSSGYFTNADDPEDAEYMVGVQWTSTRDPQNAVRLQGPTIRGTVRRILSPERAAALQAAFDVAP